MREAIEAIEKILAAEQKQEAWKRILSWYRQASGGKALPSREHLDRIATEKTELYRCRPPEGLRVPILVMPSEVEYIVPEEADIAQAVRGVKWERAGGPTGMQAGDLKVWMREVSR